MVIEIWAALVFAAAFQGILPGSLNQDVIPFFHLLAPFYVAEGLIFARKVIFKTESKNFDCPVFLWAIIFSIFGYSYGFTLVLYMTGYLIFGILAGLSIWTASCLYYRQPFFGE